MINAFKYFYLLVCLFVQITMRKKQGSFYREMSDFFCIWKEESENKNKFELHPREIFFYSGTS